MTTLILLTIAAAAIWVGSLYLAPFARCGKCDGTALAVTLAAPAAAAGAEPAHLRLAPAAALAGGAAAALAGFIAWRLYRWRHPGAARATALPPGVAQAARPLPGGEQRATLPP